LLLRKGMIVALWKSLQSIHHGALGNIMILILFQKISRGIPSCRRFACIHGQLPGTVCHVSDVKGLRSWLDTRVKTMAIAPSSNY
jgi:hypothetical protein